MSFSFSCMDSPVGRLSLLATDHALLAISWKDVRDDASSPCIEHDSHPILAHARTELQEYFEGLRTSFSVPLEPRGTAFQLRVWKALEEIPFGETRSYADLACALGDRKATRAVGAANGRNPLAIVVPCHRVVAADGNLTGFAGGLEAKKFLLQLESRAQRLFI